MTRTLPCVVAVGFVMVLAGAGCPIWLDEEKMAGVCVGDHCPCGSHDMCYPSYYCWENRCVYGGDCSYGCPDGYVCDGRWTCVPEGPAGCTVNGDCPTGHVCDARGTCVPEGATSCDEDRDCARGYCDIESGICVSTGACRPGIDSDCAVFGPSFVCDDRGICVPDRGPCPDGRCGCTSDFQCTGGWVCRDRRCHDPAELCDSNPCPAGMSCLESFCHVECPPATECPATQVCETGLGLCVDDADGGGECEFSSDCAERHLCVNGYCVTTCTVSEGCAEFESCQSGLCLPEMRVNAY